MMLIHAIAVVTLFEEAIEVIEVKEAITAREVTEVTEAIEGALAKLFKEKLAHKAIPAYKVFQAQVEA